MDSLASKLSLYDILAMIIPGWLLLSFFLTIFVIDDCSTCNICLTNHTCFIYLVYITGDIYFKIFVTLILSYIIGLIWNMFMNVFFASFRNFDFFIERDRLTFFLHNNHYNINNNLKKHLKHIFSDASKVIFLIFPFFTKFKFSHFNYYFHSIIIDQYYFSYYYSLVHRYSNDIPILEGQVVFLRNLILIFILYMFIPFTFSNFNLNCCFIIFVLLLLLTFFSFFTMISRQNKIYQRVWEDYYYLYMIGY